MIFFMLSLVPLSFATLFYVSVLDGNVYVATRLDYLLSMGFVRDRTPNGIFYSYSVNLLHLSLICH